MSALYRCLPAALLMTLGTTAAHAAEKSQVICQSGDLVRRVIVEVGDLSTGLPCEVVYWKDKEAPGVRRVLWNARSDAAFCDSQAGGLVDKLSSAGWNCSNDGGAPESAAAPAASNAPATAAIQPAVPATPTTTVPTVDAAAAPIAPASTLQRQTAPSATSPAIAPTTAQPSPVTPTPAPAAPATADPNLQTAAIAPAAPSPARSIDQLQTVVDANLTSLNRSVDGDFQAQIGDFGDLNSDGLDDAVVFFNYESSTADFTQFVAAYLFNGEDYHLAATKPVGGTDLAVRQVEVERIVDGSIQLRLLLNDASQTEDRRAAMVLKDGQLVELQ